MSKLSAAYKFCAAVLLSLALGACASQEKAVLDVHDNYRKAVRAADLESLRPLLTAERRADLDLPEAEAALGLIGGLSPENPAVTSVTIDGDRATIELEADLQGQEAAGTVQLLRQEGSWKVDKEDWSVSFDLTAGAGGDWAARLKEDPSARPKAVTTWTAHEGAVTRAAFTADGQHLVSIGYDDFGVRVWDSMTGNLVSETTTPSRPTDLVVHPGTGDVVVANVHGNVLIYPLTYEGLGEPRELRNAAGPAARLALSRDGKTLATTGSGVATRLWNFGDGTEQKALSGPRGLRGLAFSPRERLLAAGTAGNAFILWDLDAKGLGGGRTQVTIPKVADKSDVWTVAISPDGKKLLTGHMDSSITLWDLKSRKQIHNTFVQDASTFAVAWSPDGTLFASAQQNGKVYLWDTATVQRMMALEGHTGHATTVAFCDADPQRLATGGEDGIINIWK